MAMKPRTTLPIATFANFLNFASFPTSATYSLTHCNLFAHPYLIHFPYSLIHIHFLALFFLTHSLTHSPCSLAHSPTHSRSLIPTLPTGISLSPIPYFFHSLTSSFTSFYFHPPFTFFTPSLASFLFLTHSFIYFLTHCFTHYLTLSFLHFPYSFTHSQSFIHSHSLRYSFIHSFFTHFLPLHKSLSQPHSLISPTLTY